MGHNGNNRKTISDMQQGFSKSANRTAERIVFGPKSFRNSIARAVLMATSRPSPKTHSPRKETPIKDKPSDTGVYVAKESISEQRLYKCDCGKISYLESGQAYCPSCGKWLSSEKIISTDEVMASSQDHSALIAAIVSISIIVFFLLIFICL